MKTAAKSTPALSWDRIDAARKSAGIADDDVPAGAFTIKQYAKKYGLPCATADNQLSALADQGALKTGKKHSLTQNGRRTSMRFYWPV